MPPVFVKSGYQWVLVDEIVHTCGVGDFALLTIVFPANLKTGPEAKEWLPCNNPEKWVYSSLLQDTKKCFQMFIRVMKADLLLNGFINVGFPSDGINSYFERYDATITYTVNQQYAGARNPGVELRDMLTVQRASGLPTLPDLCWSIVVEFAVARPGDAAKKYKEIHGAEPVITYDRSWCSDWETLWDDQLNKAAMREAVAVKLQAVMRGKLVRNKALKEKKYKEVDADLRPGNSESNSNAT